LIVFVHGSGPGGIDDFSWYTSQLNDLGIACLVAEKVMDGYTGVRRRYDLLADDANDALRWARSRPELRGVPTALLGYSEGTWVATKAAARSPDLIDLLVLCSAPLTRPRDQAAYHRAHTNPRATAIVRCVRYAAAWTVMATLTDYGNCDITDDLRSIPVPVVLVLGAEDPTIDIGRARRIFNDARQGTPPPIIVPGSDHALPPDSPWVGQIAAMLAPQSAGSSNEG
jgi:pimeloyl-ACP methyl ester carboxylesterase